MGPSWPDGGWPGERCVASASRAQAAEPRRQCLPGYWLGYGISALFACEGLLTVGGPEMRHVVIGPHQDTRTAAVGPAGPGRGRSRRAGGVLFRAVADRAAPAACPGPPVRHGRDRHHWAVLRTGTGPDTRPFDYLVAPGARLVSDVFTGPGGSAPADASGQVICERSAAVMTVLTSG